MVERCGTKLEDVLRKSEPWIGVDCLREKCLHCNTKLTDKKSKNQSCSKRNLLYEIWCKECEKDEIEKIEEKCGDDEKMRLKMIEKMRLFKYIGETNRSLFERSSEHVYAMESLNSNSFMLKHSVDRHEGEKLNGERFGVRVLQYTKTSFERQVLESVKIQENKNHHLLNSKSEYNRCAIPRLTSKIGEKIYGEWKEEEKLEKELEIKLEEKIRMLRKERNRERQRERQEKEKEKDLLPKKKKRKIDDERKIPKRKPGEMKQQKTNFNLNVIVENEGKISLAAEPDEGLALSEENVVEDVENVVESGLAAEHVALSEEKENEIAEKDVESGFVTDVEKGVAMHEESGVAIKSDVVNGVAMLGRSGVEAVPGISGKTLKSEEVYELEITENMGVAILDRNGEEMAVHGGNTPKLEEVVKSVAIENMGVAMPGRRGKTQKSEDVEVAVTGISMGVALIDRNGVEKAVNGRSDGVVMPEISGKTRKSEDVEVATHGRSMGVALLDRNGVEMEVNGRSDAVVMPGISGKTRM